MRFILVILLFCTATAFAGTDMTIRDSISAQTSVSPDKMSSSISLTYHSKSFAETTKQMERAASIIKSYSDICDFKSYSVSPPEYQYNDRTKVLVGYQGISQPPHALSIKQLSLIQYLTHSMLLRTKTNRYSFPSAQFTGLFRTKHAALLSAN